MGIYFFYGDEEYLIDKELEKFRSKLDKNFSEMNYVVHDKLTYTDLIAVLRVQPMMFGKIMVVINCHSLLPDKGTKRMDLLAAAFEDYQIEEIEGALNSNNEMVDIFFVEKYPRDDKKKKPDTRRKIYKLLSKFNSKEFPSIPTFKTSELTNIIQSMAKEKSVKIASDAMTELIRCKGNNLRDFDAELNKLQLLAYPEKTITKQMVEEMCSTNLDIFNLTDYIMTGQFGKALLELRQLLVTKYPMEILSPIQTMLKKWIYMKLNFKTMSFKEIGLKLGMHEYKVQKELEKMKNTKLKTLVDLRQKLAEAEYKIKTGQAYNPQEELENAIIG